MALPPKPIPPQLLAEARRLYEQTNVPVHDICAMLNLSMSAFYQRVRKWRWLRRADRIPSTPPPAPADEAVGENPAEAAPQSGNEVARSSTPAKQTQEQLVAVAVRVQRTVEREMAAIERIVATLRPEPASTADAKLAADAMASLTRTVRELQIICTIQFLPAERKDDEPQERSDDELRAELVRKIEAALAAQQSESLRGSEV